MCLIFTILWCYMLALIWDQLEVKPDPFLVDTPAPPRKKQAAFAHRNLGMIDHGQCQLLEMDIRLQFNHEFPMVSCTKKAGNKRKSAICLEQHLLASISTSSCFRRNCPDAEGWVWGKESPSRDLHRKLWIHIQNRFFWYRQYYQRYQTFRIKQAGAHILLHTHSPSISLSIANSIPTYIYPSETPPNTLSSNKWIGFPNH